MKVMEMEIIKKKLPWLVKVAFKYFVRWLVKELLDELQEGVRFKVSLDGKDYDIVIKLADHRNLNNPVLIVD
jgi:hypothetical protein